MAAGRRTYIYKLTSDRGGAPCAPKPPAGGEELLTLSICKPAIRRTAQVGDRLLGLTSHALAATDGYPLNAVIYAAVVSESIAAEEYYSPGSPFQGRPDCIYEFHQRNGRIEHAGRSTLHADPAYRPRDLGHYPYKNGWALACREFRYFGSEAVAVPSRLAELRHVAETLGQGHRVVHTEALDRELDALFRMLWRRLTRYTPATVTDEAYGHGPKMVRDAGRLGRATCLPKCQSKRDSSEATSRGAGSEG